MQTSLLAIAKKAQEKKDLRFFNLYRLIDEAFLLDCWRDIRKNAASGVDRISAHEYGENLMDNIKGLVERLKRKTYRARLVRRHWIPKPDGSQRPLGIPVVEDKLLQLAVTRILEAIYEQDFLRCSYGYRPNRGALDAVDKLNGAPGAARFDFLGFEFRWGKDRAGRPHVKRRTSRKKLRNSLANFTAWCKQSRHMPLRELFASLNRKLRGYYNYYGVPGNSGGVKEFHREAMGTWWKWLNRRSQRRSFTRQGFDDLLEHFQAPRPRIKPLRRPAFNS